MMKRLCFVPVILSLLLAACGSSSSHVAAIGGALTGADALSSVTNFHIREDRPVFKWTANSLEDLSFVIRVCKDGECATMYRIDCSKRGQCIVTDVVNGNGDTFSSHRFQARNDNGQRSYRLEICDVDRFEFKSDVQVQIQAQSSFGSGAWVTGARDLVSNENSCNF